MCFPPKKEGVCEGVGRRRLPCVGLLLPTPEHTQRSLNSHTQDVHTEADSSTHTQKKPLTHMQPPIHARKRCTHFIIFHKRATKYRSLWRKMTSQGKGSYESWPPCNMQTKPPLCVPPLHARKRCTYGSDLVEHKRDLLLSTPAHTHKKLLYILIDS